MELRIVNQPAVPEIQWNYQEIIAELKAKTEMYNSLTYTEEQVTEAKKDLSALNALTTVLNNKRIEVKNRCLLPYTVFERQMGEVLAVLEEPKQAIKTQTDAFEDERRKKKAEECRQLFAEAGFPDWVEFGKISKKRWLNKTCRPKEIREELQATLEKITADMHELEQLPEFAFEAQETYKKSYDVDIAKSAALDMARIQRKREEYERAKAEATQAHQSRTEATSDNVRQNTRTTQANAPQASVERQWIGFKAFVSMEEAQNLSNYLREHNIEFKPV